MIFYLFTKEIVDGPYRILGLDKENFISITNPNLVSRSTS